jgi:hypothetical protein
MHKTCPVQIKAAGTEDGLAEGQFRAVVSVFGNKDAYGDVVVPGAFKDTLSEWEATGDKIPVYWSHQMQDPDFNVGWVESAKETDQGLEVTAQLDLEDGASPKARQVYRLLKGRRVTQFSFAYDVLDGGPVEKDGDTVFELRKLKLYEVGPTPVGANDSTELLAVKTLSNAATLCADLKAGRVLSAKNEDALREALASIEASAASLKNVLTAVENTDEGGKANTTPEDASGGGPANDEEPHHGAKSEEPSRHSSADTWAAYLSIAELEGVQP